VSETTAPETVKGPSDEEIIGQLKQVYDPELGVNIVDLGLVYRLDLSEEGEMQVFMTLTSPGCPAGPELRNEVKSSLESLENIKEVKVNFVFNPPWSPAMMSREAKDELGMEDDYDD
jgi:metal-sulfur cluster biosynthetic enzyme